MQPTIHDGDVITLVSLDERRLKLGDVVLHRNQGGGLAAHRIIRISRRGLGQTLHTRGDASGGTSDLVEEEDILGRATLIEHEGEKSCTDSLVDRLKGTLWAGRQTLRHLYRRCKPYPGR